MKTSITDSFDYLNSIKEMLNDENVFNNFKRNPSYTGILEGTTYDLGLQYLEIIKFENPHLLEINRRKTIKL